MEKLGIDPKLLLAQIINFAIFYVIVRKFIAKPFSKFLDDERSNDLEKQKLLEEAQKGEERLLKKEAEMDAKLKKEMAKVIAEAKANADESRKEMIAEAKLEASKIKDNAKAEIQAEKQKLYGEIKDKVSDLSLFMVNKALEESLDSDMKKKVSQKLLNNLVKKTVRYEN